MVAALRVLEFGAGFSNIPGKYENVVMSYSLSKILETGIKVFEKLSMITSCNI